MDALPGVRDTAPRGPAGGGDLSAPDPLFLLFPANYGLRFALVLHAVLGYSGQFLLARRLGLARRASTFAALVLALTGYPIAHLLAGHVNLLLADGCCPGPSWHSSSC